MFLLMHLMKTCGNLVILNLLTQNVIAPRLSPDLFFKKIWLSIQISIHLFQKLMMLAHYQN